VSKIRYVLVAIVFVAVFGITPDASANNQGITGPTHTACDAVNGACAHMRSSITVLSSSNIIRGATQVWCDINGVAARCERIDNQAAFVYRQGVVDPSTLMNSSTLGTCTTTCPVGVRTVTTANHAWQLSYAKLGTTTWLKGSSPMSTMVWLPGGRLTLKGDGTASPDGVPYTASSTWCNA
jgi:hypothetical protein